jgi:uncharacterized surface protein with fasciclin (FAS1) repeats
MATIIQISNADRNLSQFSKGIKLAGLEEKLNGFGPFTILGPVNLALGRMGDFYENLLQPANKGKLIDFLSDYVLTGKKLLLDFRNNQKIGSLGGNQVTVEVKNGDIHLNGAKILARDRQGSNGVVHLLDTTFTVETSTPN